jgi:CRISPR-associated protein Cas2
MAISHSPGKQERAHITKTGIDMFILISYDIANDKRRTKIAKALEGKGTRVQYSVFECQLTRKQLHELKTKLQRLMAPVNTIPKPTDSIRFYKLCESCLQEIEILGEGQVTRDKLYYIV